MTSLFRRIARYACSDEREEGENRLTEVFAAVLAQVACRGLAQHVALDWLHAGRKTPKATELFTLLTEGEWSCDVDTQVPVYPDGESRRIDLELRFRSIEDLGQPEIVIDVEVKLGSGPHDNQLEAYQKARAGFGHAIVVLVAPRAGYAIFGKPAGEVPALTWEATAASVSRWDAGNQIGDFIRDELLEYLREESLMPPERLTPEHLVALAHHTEAFEALEYIREAANAFVIEHWSERVNEGKKYGEWWHHYRADPRDVDPLRDALTGWSLWDDSSRILVGGPRGLPLFQSGIRIDEHEEAGIETGAREKLLEVGFRFLRKRAELKYNIDGTCVWRLAYPDEVLAGSSLDEQGASLGWWVVESFDLLRSILLHQHRLRPNPPVPLTAPPRAPR